jgi:hypothetical protein
MKKLSVILVLALLLCGCGEAQTFETVADEMVLSASAQPRQILLTLPEETLLPAMETDTGTLYLCNGYDVAVQTMESGDLDATVRQVCGFSSDDITIMQTTAGENTCYEFGWSAATELGEEVGRAMILEDRDYHYVLCAVAPAKKALEYQEIWNGMFESFGIA